MREPESNDNFSQSAADQAGAAGGAAAKTGPAAQPAGAPETPEVPGLAEARAEAAANLDRYVRAVADLENFRRRAVREKDELRSVVTGRVLEDVFPVLDNLARALAASQQPNADLKSVVGGVEMVLAQLRSAVAAHGLKEINPAGQAFDPHQHEAISHQPSADVKPEHVLTVVRTGYSLNGRLLRPAAVIVSSGSAGEAKS